MFEIPILFLIFNRADTAEKVFAQIRAIKPKKLYVAADGPRDDRDGEASLCEITREVVKDIDWDCEVKTLFRDKNLGCKVAVSEAINWFFQNEEMGIILEDDCLPNNSFFMFCREMLLKYRDNEQIMMISGDNFQRGHIRGNGSYYFTRFPHIWGWATWRRAWSRYDLEISDYPEFLDQKIIEDIFPNDRALQRYWIANFDRVYKEHMNTWDYQWVYSILKNSAFCVAPNYNLISNIGFREDATHTTSLESNVANMPTQEISKIEHPDFVVVDYDADQFSRNYVFYIPQEIHRGIVYRGLRKVKHILWK